MNLDNLIRDNVKRLKPYSSARDEYKGEAKIQMDANENPYGEGLNRYPDPYQMELKQAIADLKGGKTDNLFLGNGSDEIIDLLFRAFCEPGIDNVVTIAPSYGMYKVSADINGVELRTVLLDENFQLDADLLLKSTDENTKLIFLCSPNNPTGNLLDENEINKVLDRFKGLLVIDEAYIDFANSKSWSKTLNNYTQLIVLQTLSKSFGLAGVRLGISWSSNEIVRVLNKIKPPYNVNELTQKVAWKALQSTQDTTVQIAKILKERERLTNKIVEFRFVERVYPTDANFFLMKVENADELYMYLLENGIVVRNRSNLATCENCLRVTVGTKEENDMLIDVLKNYKS